MDVHLPSSPLHLLDDIQAAMHDELVHMSRLLWEPSHAITTLFRCPEFMLKDWVVFRADDCKVVGHCCGIKWQLCKSNVSLW